MRRIRSALPFALVLPLVVGACSPTASEPSLTPTGAAPSVPASAPVTPTTPPTLAPTAVATASLPTVFTSPLYHYTITIAAGWKAVAATQPWDTISMTGHEAPQVDSFASTQVAASSWAFAGEVSVDLAAFTRDQIAANARDHGDTCPPSPEVTEPIRIGGKKGNFIAWNCGILINAAVTVRNGVGYVFALRDPSVHAATNPSDRALFDSLLASVVFPG